MRKWIPQLSFIWLPLSLAIVYYFAIASERYVSEAKFILQQNNAENPVSFDLGSLIGGSSTARQDALLVQEYIHSLDLLRLLDEELQLRQHYSNPERDFISRLPRDASQEDFLDYYRKRVGVAFDDISSVVTITVDAFDAEYSRHLTQSVLDAGERFVNSIGHLMAEDQMNFVADQTSRAQAQLRGAKQNVIAFQDTHDLVSPRGETDSRVGIISAMEAELSKEKAELKNLLGFLNSNAPQVLTKRNHIDALNQQIQAEKARLSGREGEQLNDLVARFEDIQMNLEFAADVYRSSITALETARVEASRKLKHLIVIASPGLPEEALYPRRLYSLTTMLVFLTLIYGIGRLTVATIKDHRD